MFLDVGSGRECRCGEESGGGEMRCHCWLLMFVFCAANFTDDADVKKQSNDLFNIAYCKRLPKKVSWTLDNQRREIAEIVVGVILVMK